jgi:hypothetical protein
MRRAPWLWIVALLALPAGVRAADGAQVEAAPPSGTPAPEGAWNLSAGTGGGGFVEFASAFSQGDVGAYDATRREDRLQLNARADHELGRRVRAGVAYVYNRWTDGLLLGGARVGGVENRVHTLLVDATARWIRTERIELYSAVAVGAGRWSQEGSGTAAAFDRVTSGFAFQLRYIGLAVGNERVRAFVDLGIGFEGLIVGGLTLRL